MLKVFFDQFANRHFCRHRVIYIRINSGDDTIIGYSAFYPVKVTPWLMSLTAGSNEIKPLDIIALKDQVLELWIYEEAIYIKTIDIEYGLEPFLATCLCLCPFHCLLAIVSKIKSWAEVKV